MKEQNTFETICAWCEPNCKRPNVTHGICAEHKAQMLGKKPEGSEKESKKDLKGGDCGKV